jgi:hypothetical protein
MPEKEKAVRLTEAEYEWLRSPTFRYLQRLIEVPPFGNLATRAWTWSRIAGSCTLWRAGAARWRRAPACGAGRYSPSGPYAYAGSGLEIIRVKVGEKQSATLRPKTLPRRCRHRVILMERYFIWVRIFYDDAIPV